LDACALKGWKQVDEPETADFHWMDRQYDEKVWHAQIPPKLEAHQIVNHYRNHWELTHKDKLARNLNRFKAQLEKDGKTKTAETYNFYPESFVLPGEAEGFKKSFTAKGGAWIVKPVSSACGKGIEIIEKLEEIPFFNEKSKQEVLEPCVVQQYVANPLLIDGKKFDMRLYALVSSFNPLCIHMHRDGFARLTTKNYDPTDLKNKMIHLTNVAVQKTSADYNSTTGGKLYLRPMKLLLVKKYGHQKVNEMMREIQRLVIESLLAVKSKIHHDDHCFELYGYDVMLDENLKPWLIEVNAYPSMTGNTDDDKKRKCEILHDVFGIIDCEKRVNGAFTPARFGGFDLIYSEGEVAETSKLGMETNTAKILRRLAVWVQKRQQKKKMKASPNGTAAPCKTQKDDLKS